MVCLLGLEKMARYHFISLAVQISSINISGGRIADREVQLTWVHGGGGGFSGAPKDGEPSLHQRGRLNLDASSVSVFHGKFLSLRVVPFPNYLSPSWRCLDSASQGHLEKSRDVVF